MTRDVRQLAAIEAIATGRFTQAHTIVLELVADTDRPVVRGQCRYCGCTDEHGCAIMVVPGPEFDPTFIRCQWADEERSICTNARCLDRWQREQPEFAEVSRSRLVMP